MPTTSSWAVLEDLCRAERFLQLCDIRVSTAQLQHCLTSSGPVLLMQWQDRHALHAPLQESDGRAFLVRSINNSFVGISQLSDSYTDTTGLVSVAPRVSNCLCRTGLL